LGFGFNDLSKITEQQNELATSPAFDRLILEIQRSLDYYDRYFMQAPIGNIVVSPFEVELPDFIQSVESSLGIRSRWLDLNEVIKSETELNAEIQQQCLLAVGAALRKEKRAL
jgi:MSHA biogenesis protein MshI